jgi:hypothetical protein
MIRRCSLARSLRSLKTQGSLREKRGKHAHDPLAGEVEVIAVVTKEKVALPDGVKVLSPRRPDEVADFIEERFL